MNFGTRNFGNFNKPRKNIETEKSKSKVFLFTGHLGSGKTTLINNLLKFFSTEERENTLIIINDVGTQNIDFSRLEGQNKDLDITPISGNGCICCGDLASFETELKKIREEEKISGKAKNLIIEPSGIAEPDQMNATLKKYGFEAVITSSINSLVLKGKNIDEIKKFVNENLAISDFICLCNTGSYFDEEAKNILEKITNGEKNIRIIPKGSLSIENMTGEENTENPFSKLLEELKNKNVTQRKNIFKIKNNSEKKPEITISRENTNISRYKLLNILKVFGEYLVRAKGVLSDNKDFDISFGGVVDIKRIPDLDKETKTYKISEKRNKQFNFIFSGETPKEIIEIFEKVLENSEEENKDFYEKYFWSNGIPEITKEKDYDFKIQKLIYQFDDYMDLDTKKTEIIKEIKNLENIKNEEEKIEKTLKLEKKLTEKIQSLNKLGDDMKYDNPIIWLKYKFEAYKGSNSEIATVGDLIKHCFKNLDYICGKRIDFLAKNLKNKFGINIFEIDKNMNLEKFFEKFDKELNYLCQDKNFMNLWLKYEYFTIGDKVAKWENYRRSKTFYDINLK